jgi:ribosomal-protein-alanine N-acetyltransferase
VLGDAETMRYYPAPYDRAGVEAWIERNRRRYREAGHGLWAMELKDDGTMIGDCGLVSQRVEGATEIEIAYHVHRAYWRRGLATEAARACRDRGFNVLGFRRLISLIRPENMPSRRVAEKNGLRVERALMWGDFQHLLYVIERQA